MTLSLKNMLGIVPGQKYGRPKNLLHWHGITERILDIYAAVPIHFVIADGIVGWRETDPYKGHPAVWEKSCWQTIPWRRTPLARASWDSILKIEHIAEAGRFLGNAHSDRIRQLSSWKPGQPFQVLPAFEHMVAD